MTISVALSQDEGIALALSEDELNSVFEVVLNSESIERACNVSVSVVSARHMQEINLEWRGIDTPTDVISLECERPDDPDLAPDEPCELGDIFMAPEVLAVQAQKFGTSEADETRLMAIHSLLHLLGYDHIDEQDAIIMEQREDELLAKVCSDSLGHIETTRHTQDGGNA